MQTIIPPIPKDIIRQELSSIRLLRTSNKAENEIYIFSASEAPNTMQEIGRLREHAFRAGGGGTGLATDIDEFDTHPEGYKQLIVWNPKEGVIIGGYRYIQGKDILKSPLGANLLATSHMFDYSEEFIEKYLPYTIELGRSFVTQEFQATHLNNLSIFALDNLWDGLGALTVIHPENKYFFGKITMYPSYDRYCRNLILYFMNKYFHDDKKLIFPKEPLSIDIDKEEVEKLFSANNLNVDYRVLKQEIRKFGINIPPLINAYISLSPKLLMLGTAINYEFGDVEETGILVPIGEILEEKKKRHIDTFQPPTN
ncbi:GNAT family N-acetyltransferase [Porphyromonas circumdentaria]|uniref:Acetyltransferase (GNAT) domain-containing protein n=1 Tax=Porphyromonas circumdentaria TaxID=29524 RepID=A0A1T4MUU4_9PORP|nr:GNAT family N-acetyltransferase [Porphyromonas circumdentaria]MBB6275940.1 hypothetical protein [Porphyromonas circumdentaria]SJZ70671.1 Acetyltransferase (GNAT) domain-containing protein [Porphyromonas circumdentaria]